MTNYTRKEIETVNKAWSMLEELCRNADMGTSARTLKVALQHEKRVRLCLTAAKALIVECFHRGARFPDMPISELADYAMGLQLAMLLGARMRQQVTTLDTSVFADADQAHAASIARNRITWTKVHLPQDCT